MAGLICRRLMGVLPSSVSNPLSSLSPILLRAFTTSSPLWDKCSKTQGAHLYDREPEIRREPLSRALTSSSSLTDWHDVRALSVFLSKYNSIHDFMRDSLGEHPSAALDAVRISRIEWDHKKNGVLLVSTLEGVEVLESLQKQLHEREPLNPSKLSRRRTQYALQLNPQAWACWVGNEKLALFLLNDAQDTLWHHPLLKNQFETVQQYGQKLPLSTNTTTLFRTSAHSGGKPTRTKPEIRDLEEPSLDMSQVLA